MPKKLALLALLAACVRTPYRPGQLTESTDGVAYPNAARAGECLDFAAWWLPSSEVAPHFLVMVAFGNRCDHTVPIDLSGMSVQGIYRERSPAQLTPIDPDRELRERRLAPHGHGSERIAFFDHDAFFDHEPTDTPRELCVGFPGGERRTCVPRSPE